MTRAVVVAVLSIALLVGAHPASARDRVPATAATITMRVPVAARAIVRGATLTDADIVYEERTIGRGIVVDTTVTPGWITRRVINRGEILRAPAVQAPPAVLANTPLDLGWSNGTVSLSIRGIASRTAAIGERISVRLPDNRRLDAIVTAPGKARIL